MKKTLFLTALLCSATALHAAVGDTVNLVVPDDYSLNGFIADGVKGTNGYFYGGEFTSDVKTTTRFYDSTKGWAREDKDSDTQMCWAHTASNMIQYWQSYYGVFYKGNFGELPYGSDYTRTLQSPMAGVSSTTIVDPMRLNVAHKILNHYQYNDAGYVYDAINYYFTWVEDDGGYFSEYYGSVRAGQSNYDGQTSTVTEITSLSSFTNALLPALGISKNGNTYTQTEAGLIAHLNISDGENSHTLTCYGMTLDTNGNVKTVVYADSDDNRLNTVYANGRVPVLSTAYVSEENGNIYLYKKDATSGELVKIYPSANYYVGGVTQINTPEVLKNMLAEYSDTTGEAQVWNGAGSEWGKQTATTEALPTEATGWDINVNGSNIAAEHQGYYHTYATEGRAVLFDDHAAEDKRTVTICGEVAASLITVAAEGYVFQAADSGGSIAAEADLALVNGATLDSSVVLNVRDLTLEGNTTIKSDAAIVVTGDFLAALAPQAATFAAVRSTVTPQATVNAPLDLRQADSVTLETSVNMNGNNLYIADAFKLVLNMVEDEVIPCFTNIGELYIGDTKQDSFQTATQVYFGGDANNPVDYFLVYDSALSTLSLMLSIPEPTTATLGLLALAAMAARRRRS